MKKILILVVTILFLSGCAVSNEINDGRNNAVQSDFFGDDQPSELPESYLFLNQQVSDMRDNFHDKVLKDFSSYNITSENIKSGALIQDDLKFVFSTSSDERGEVLDVVSIYNKNILVKKIVNFGIENLLKLSFDDNDYYTVIEYTGGAHCCYINNPMVVRNKKLKIGEPMGFANVTGLSGDRVFNKDGHLYFYTYDDRFSYFYTSFAESGVMWYPKFFMFQTSTGNYVDMSAEFKPYYLWLANDIDGAIKSIDARKEKDVTAQQRMPFAISKAVHRLVGGENKEVVKKDFEEDYLRNKHLFLDDGTEELPTSSEMIWNEILSKISS